MIANALLARDPTRDIIKSRWGITAARTTEKERQSLGDLLCHLADMDSLH